MIDMWTKPPNDMNKVEIEPSDLYHIVARKRTKGCIYFIFAELKR